MTRRGSLGFVLAIWAAAGCAAPLGPSLSHDETQLFRADYFDWPRLKSGGLGLLGVTSTVAPEGIREDVAFVLDQAASNYLTRLRLVPHGDAAARAREVGMGADLDRLLRNYEVRGAIDAGVLRRIASAEGVRYFLVARIARYERTTREMEGPPTVAVTPGMIPPKRTAERVQRIRLLGEVWDSRCGNVVWSGEGGTEAVEEAVSEDVRLQDVLSMAATNLVSLLPRPGDASKAVEKECGA
ncbi:MAG TPA: hypothetical protein VFN94_07665 [Nitrospiria bacterium]|nr:hypothetical protein [Nitrospiria bacterium]